jgi:hypothetical protein
LRNLKRIGSEKHRFAKRDAGRDGDSTPGLHAFDL